MKTKYLLPLVIIALPFFRLGATTVVPPTFEQLVRQAELIFQGTVIDVRSVWEGEGAQRHIESYVTFQVEDGIKGSVTGTYTIQMLGGTVGDETFVISDAPKFQVGDRDVLFVENNGQQFVPLVGIMFGQFRVQHDEQTGRDIVVGSEGATIGDVTKLGRAPEESVGPAQALSVGDFKATIRNQLSAGSSGQ